jgi:uncharacterized protein GlcG (DUF336 family)
MFSNARTRMTRPLVLGLLAVAVASGVARAQATSGVFDGAGMFSDDALRRARADLSRIDRAHGVALSVETVTSLKGEAIDEVAVRQAARLGHKGIFVFIAEKDHKAEALASPRTLFEELGKTRLNEIRDAFTNEFRRGKNDDGLLKGIQAAEKVLAAVRPTPIRPVPAGGGFLPSTTPEGSSSGISPLVLRQQVRLTLAGARKTIEGAEAKATREGWKMNIAVVDDGGHLLAFERMDGARPASVATATTKAITAATFRQATGPLPGPVAGPTPDILLNVSVQNASGGKITTLLGGVPIVVDGQVIGAIGVGGGSGEQDAETAKAGLAAFLEGLQAKPEESKPKPKEPEGESKPKEADPATIKPAQGDASPK